jgi:hypothetical protein
MTLIADINVRISDRRTGCYDITAGTGKRRFLIFWMNSAFHSFSSSEQIKRGNYNPEL